MVFVKILMRFVADYDENTEELGSEYSFIRKICSI